MDAGYSNSALHLRQARTSRRMPAIARLFSLRSPSQAFCFCLVSQCLNLTILDSGQHSADHGDNKPFWIALRTGA